MSGGRLRFSLFCMAHDVRDGQVYCPRVYYVERVAELQPLNLKELCVHSLHGIQHLYSRSEASGHRRFYENLVTPYFSVDTHGLTPVALAEEVCIYLEG